MSRMVRLEEARTNMLSASEDMRTWTRNTETKEDWTTLTGSSGDYFATPDPAPHPHTDRSFSFHIDRDGVVNVKHSKEKKVDQTATITIKDNKLTVKVKDNPDDSQTLVDVLRALSGDLGRF